MKINISENIRKFRKERGLTQEQLAEVLGVTVGAVSKWELGSSVPDLELIVDMAEFFDTSVDVLLGYEWQSGSMGECLQKIKECRKAKDFENGRKIAEKALKQYPNCFDIIYHSASLYHVTGIETKNEKYIERALELFEKACDLIEQNTDSSISVVSVQIEIAELLLILGRREEAIERLKKYNYNGMNNDNIGYALATECHRYDEALPYLSEALVHSMTVLFRVCIGYANALGNKGDIDAAMQVLLWLKDIYSGLKIPNENSYLDKGIVGIWTACACLIPKEDEAGMRKYLQEAVKVAKRFDAAPDYSMRNVKFYYGPQDKVAFDDMGSTAMESIENIISQGNDDAENVKMLRDVLQSIIFVNE